MTTTPTPKRKGISETTLAAGARSGDAAALFQHLDKIGWDEDRPGELIALIRRAKALMFTRADPAAEALSNQFLQDVQARLVARAPEAAEPLAAARLLIERAEEGYRRISAYRKTLPVAAWSGARVAAGLIAVAEHGLAEIDRRVDQAVERDGVSVPGGINIGEPDGPPINPDGALSMVVETLGGALRMEAYERGWYDAAGALILPPLEPVSPADLDDAADDTQLGGWWGRWRALEETARYLNGSIELDAPSHHTVAPPPEITRILYGPCVQDHYDFIANERYGDRSGIVSYDLMTLAHDDPRFLGVEHPVALPPEGFVSGRELTQGHMLSQRLGFDITPDLRRFGGLRLLQWVRGYLALSTWYESRDAEGAIQSATTAELSALLERVGFNADEANVFLSAVTFGKRARDLYDAPLIRTGDAWTLIGPGLRHVDAAKTVPSLLASLNISLDIKGDAYNDRVLKLLRDEGLDARTITRQFKEGEYDYDVLVPWGDHLFLFECKNYRLSNGDPKEVLHFRQELVSALNQVRRLRTGLEMHPEILTDLWGPSILGKTLVPCVLFNEPYAREGDIEGIYVYDFSALSRFFDSSAFHFSRDHRLPDGRTARVQADVVRVWAGNTPVAEDLLTQLKAPYQLTILRAQLAYLSVAFGLDAATGAVSDRLVRRRLTEAELLEAMGVDPEPIMAILERGAAQVERLRAATR